MPANKSRVNVALKRPSTITFDALRRIREMIHELMLATEHERQGFLDLRPNRPGMFEGQYVVNEEFRRTP